MKLVGQLVHIINLQKFDIPDDEPLEINDPFFNLFVLSDIFGSEGGYIESGDDPSIPLRVNEEGNSRTSAYMEEVARLTFSLKLHHELEEAFAS